MSLATTDSLCIWLIDYSDALENSDFAEAPAGPTGHAPLYPRLHHGGFQVTVRSLRFYDTFADATRQHALTVISRPHSNK